MHRYILLLALLITASAAVPALSSSGAPPTSPAYKGTPIKEGLPASLEPQVIRVIAKQYEFIPKTISVKRNIPVRIILTSADVFHGFAIDEFKVNATIEKGKETTVTFTPFRSGAYVFYCSVFCGVGHQDMKGTLIVE